MTVTKMLIHVPESLKAKLDAKRAQGYSVSGFIRALLEREFRKPVHKSQRKVKHGETRA